MLQLTQATTEAHFQQVRELIAEYIAWDLQVTGSLGFDVAALTDFHYAHAVDDFPGEFVPPQGCLLLATYSGQAAGCGALRKFSDDAGEVKRMFVRPAFRGKRVGRTLLEALMAQARTTGYARLLLETTTFMTEAQALYTSLGFALCEPYYEIPDALKPYSVFMECRLRSKHS